jgi:hypothetical protein
MSTTRTIDDNDTIKITGNLTVGGTITSTGANSVYTNLPDLTGSGFTQAGQLTVTDPVVKWNTITQTLYKYSPWMRRTLRIFSSAAQTMVLAGAPPTPVNTLVSWTTNLGTTALAYNWPFAIVADTLPATSLNLFNAISTTTSVINFRVTVQWSCTVGPGVTYPNYINIIATPPTTSFPTVVVGAALSGVQSTIIALPSNAANANLSVQYQNQNGVAVTGFTATIYIEIV